MKTSTVTVSVVSHEHADEVPHLLEDLATFAPRIVKEVIVTLNIPEPGLLNWIESNNWPFSVRVVENLTPLGYGANHNQAFRYCSSEYFCIANPDIRFSVEPFAPLILALQMPDAGCSYPLQSNEMQGPADYCRELPSPVALLKRYLWPGYRKKEQPRHWINGSFMLFPAHQYAELGGFDERYFMYCEDVDISLRLLLSGKKIILNQEVVVEHKAQHGSRKRISHLIWHLQSLWRLWFSESYISFKKKLQNEPSLSIERESIAP